MAAKIYVIHNEKPLLLEKTPPNLEDLHSIIECLYELNEKSKHIGCEDVQEIIESTFKICANTYGLLMRNHIIEKETVHNGAQ